MIMNIKLLFMIFMIQEKKRGMGSGISYAIICVYNKEEQNSEYVFSMLSIIWLAYYLLFYNRKKKPSLKIRFEKI